LTSRVSRVNEVSELAVVDRLGEGAVEQDVLDIQLVHRLAPEEGQSQHGANGGGLHDEAESLIVVHTGALGEPTKDPACLVPVQRAIRLELVLEDPLARHHIDSTWSWYQVPGVVGQQSLVLLFHSAAPVGVDERATDRGQGRRQRR
jgi:hypothetical protein